MQYNIIESSYNKCSQVDLYCVNDEITCLVNEIVVKKINTWPINNHTS